MFPPSSLSVHRVSNRGPYLLHTVSPSLQRRGPLAVLALFLLVEAIVFTGPLFRSETLAERDLASLYRPAKSLLRPLWKASEGLPLWNPLYSSGQPFAANPGHEVFHPLTALFLLLPFEAAFRAQFLVPPLVGGLSAFLLARTLRRSLAASALAGVGWAFGGYLLSTVNLLPILHAACVVPAVLAFVIRCGRSSSPRDVAGLAVSVGLVGLAGEPSTILALPLLAGAAILHDRPWTRTRNVLRRGTLAQAAGIVLGAGIAAAVLVPGLHHASKTVRSQGLSAEVAGAWSLPPVRILELLSPHVLGHVEESDEAWYWGRGVYTQQRVPVPLLALSRPRDLRRRSGGHAPRLEEALALAGRGIRGPPPRARGKRPALGTGPRPSSPLGCPVSGEVRRRPLPLPPRRRGSRNRLDPGETRPEARCSGPRLGARDRVRPLGPRHCGRPSLRTAVDRSRSLPADREPVRFGRRGGCPQGRPRRTRRAARPRGDAEGAPARCARVGLLVGDGLVDGRPSTGHLGARREGGGSSTVPGAARSASGLGPAGPPRRRPAGSHARIEAGTTADPGAVGASVGARGRLRDDVPALVRPRTRSSSGRRSGGDPPSCPRFSSAGASGPS